MNQQGLSKLNIEKYGLESVPNHLRNVKWHEYAFIQGAFAVNTGNFLIPAFAVLNGGLSIFHAILAAMTGAFLAFICISILSMPGAMYGIPAQYAIRFILGEKIARWVMSPIKVITSVFWFSIQVIGATILIREILLAYFKVKLSVVFLAPVISLIISIIVLLGFDTIKKTLKAIYPFLFGGQIIILYLFVKDILVNYDNSVNFLFHSNEAFSIKTFIFYSNLAFIQFIPVMGSASDLTRYAKNYKHGFYGLLAGNTLGYFITVILGATSAGIYKNINPFVVASELTNLFLFDAVILFVTIFSMISININNLYGGAFGLLNIIPKLGRIKATIIFSIVVIISSTLPDLVSNLESFINFFGLISIPFFSIVFFDFLVIKKFKLVGIDSNQDINNFNRAGAILASIGVIVYYFVPKLYSPGFFIFIFIGILYLIVMHIFSNFKKCTS